MQGKLEMGHARALLAIGGSRQAEFAHQIISRNLSVREAEQLVGQVETTSRKTPRKQPGRIGTCRPLRRSCRKSLERRSA